MVLTIKDETMTGNVLNTVVLDFLEDIVTLKDIIKSRVITEVNLFNQQKSIIFNGLVQPTEAERQLNGSYKVQKHKTIDAEKQVYIALNAFQQNAFFVLIDDQQVDSLEHAVVLNRDMNISFVKLTPLVGG
jgi:hypothetical protein